MGKQNGWWRRVSGQKEEIIGEPDVARISTSLVERQNLRIRMECRRLTRLTNAFSKKPEMDLYFVHDNVVRFHRSVRYTPAMEAEVVSSP